VVEEESPDIMVEKDLVPVEEETVYYCPSDKIKQSTEDYRYTVVEPVASFSLKKMSRHKATSFYRTFGKRAENG